MDTILDQRMHPVVSKEPEEIMRILKRPYPETWSRVLVGDTSTVVTIPEYLYRDLLSTTVATLTELVDRRDLAMYKRDPSRWNDQLLKTAIKLIKRIQDEK